MIYNDLFFDTAAACIEFLFLKMLLAVAYKTCLDYMPQVAYQ